VLAAPFPLSTAATAVHRRGRRVSTLAALALAGKQCIERHAGSLELEAARVRPTPGMLVRGSADPARIMWRGVPPSTRLALSRSNQASSAHVLAARYGASHFHTQTAHYTATHTRGVYGIGGRDGKSAREVFGGDLAGRGRYAVFADPLAVWDGKQLVKAVLFHRNVSEVSVGYRAKLSGMYDRGEEGGIELQRGSLVGTFEVFACASRISGKFHALSFEDQSFALQNLHGVGTDYALNLGVSTLTYMCHTSIQNQR
jgi:hypothetical protein